MATPPIEVEFTAIGLEQVKQSFAELAATSKETKQSVEEDAEVMAAGFRMVAVEIHVMAQTGRLIAEFGEEMGILDKTTADMITRTMRLISIFGGLMTTLGTLTRLTQTAAAAEWLHVAALKAKAVAAAIAHGISSLGAALPVIAVAAAAAAGIALAATGKIPSRELGGTISETGIYELHKGELVVPERRVKALERFSEVIKSESTEILSKELGGFIEKTGVYELHRGEFVLNRESTENLEKFVSFMKSEILRESLRSVDKSETLREYFRSADKVAAFETFQKLIKETEKVTPIILPAGMYERIPMSQQTQRQSPILVFDIHDNRFASDYDADRAGNRIIDSLRRAGVI